MRYAQRGQINDTGYSPSSEPGMDQFTHSIQLGGVGVKIESIAGLDQLFDGRRRVGYRSVDDTNQRHATVVLEADEGAIHRGIRGGGYGECVSGLRDAPATQHHGDAILPR